MIPNILLSFSKIKIKNDLNPTERAFYVLERKLIGTSPCKKQESKVAAGEAWQSIPREDTQHLVMANSRHTGRLNANTHSLASGGNWKIYVKSNT